MKILCAILWFIGLIDVKGRFEDEDGNLHERDLSCYLFWPSLFGLIGFIFFY